MWHDEDEVNENGEPVKLYLPVQAPPRKTHTAPRESHIGGHCFFYDVAPTCDKCQATMFLLVQLRLEEGHHHSGTADDDDNNDTRMDRYLCLFVCPRDECFGTLTFDQGFSSGGQGVAKCLQKVVPATTAPEKRVSSVPATTPTKSSWYNDSKTSRGSDGGGGNDDGDDDDWGMNGRGGGDDADGLVNLENAVAAMEQALDEGGAFATSSSKSSSHRSNHKQSTESTTPSEEALDNAFGCYLLKVQNEPPPSRPLVEEDDVGLTESDEKIRNMLARYMAEEEDEDILAALRGTTVGGGGGGAMEEDERLSEEARILLGFQDRLRRAPRQVVRYAPGGKPLWSIRDKDRKTKENLWTVPVCPRSGDEMNFAFQVLPPVLEILDVDKYAGNNVTKTNGGSSQHIALDDLMSNGMNFGSIAVFTCSNNSSCTEEMDAFLVIQESVDSSPGKGRRKGANRETEFPADTMAVVEDLDDDADFEPDA